MRVRSGILRTAKWHGPVASFRTRASVRSGNGQPRGSPHRLPSGSFRARDSVRRVLAEADRHRHNSRSNAELHSFPRSAWECRFRRSASSERTEGRRAARTAFPRGTVGTSSCRKARSLSVRSGNGQPGDSPHRLPSGSFRARVSVRSGNDRPGGSPHRLPSGSFRARVSVRSGNGHRGDSWGAPGWFGGHLPGEDHPGVQSGTIDNHRVPAVARSGCAADAEGPRSDRRSSANARGPRGCDGTGRRLG